MVSVNTEDSEERERLFQTVECDVNYWFKTYTRMIIKMHLEK